MLCFEVHVNGTKLCTAGIGDFGVMNAILTWVSHRPETLARWKSQGIDDTSATRLEFTVVGLLSHDDSEGAEHVKWVERALSNGDEIRVRIVDSPEVDLPSCRYRDEADFVEQKKKEYVRETAKEFGWEVQERPSENA